MSFYFGRLWFCILGMLLSSPLYAEEPKILVVESHRDVFGDSISRHAFVIRSRTPTQLQASWTVTVQGQTWNRQSESFSLLADQDMPWNIVFETPPARDGLILDGKLRLVLLDEQGTLLSEAEYLLSFYPKNPFVDRSKWLLDLDLALIDTVGATRQDLEGLHVPFRSIEKHTPLKPGKGLLIVGEGMKWDSSFKKLVEVSVKAGRPVLWMVSGEGQVDWPWESLAMDDLPEVRLRTRNWIRELDDRLGDIDEGAICFGVPILKEKALQLQWDGRRGWPFLEVIGNANGGRLLGCGLSLHREWDRRPLPRYLFARLLERLSGDMTK